MEGQGTPSFLRLILFVFFLSATCFYNYIIIQFDSYSIESHHRHTAVTNAHRTTFTEKHIGSIICDCNILSQEFLVCNYAMSLPNTKHISIKS